MTQNFARMWEAAKRSPQEFDNQIKPEEIYPWYQKFQRSERESVTDALKDQGVPYRIILGRLRTLAGKLGEAFAGEEKKQIAQLMTACAIAQEPLLLVGPPGTGKTELATRFAELLGLRRGLPESKGEQPGDDQKDKRLYFEYLLTEFTQPDELFGPWDIAALRGEFPEEEEDKRGKPELRRVSKGMLQECYVVFLDEIFRGSKAILNTLLSLLNERQIYVAGRAERANTLVIFGATNSTATASSPELQALYDRFPVRVYNEPVPSGLKPLWGLLKKGWELEKQSLQRRHTPSAMEPIQFVDQQACLNDLIVANKLTAELVSCLVEIRQPVLQQYAKLACYLRKDGGLSSHISDRSFVRLLKVVCALGLLREQDKSLPDKNNLNQDKLLPTLADVETVLQYTWSHEDEREYLAKQVKEYAEKLGCVGKARAPGTAA